MHQAIQANIIKYWVFQGSTEMYDIQKALSNDTLKDWTVTAHREKIKIGDKVILWMTGNNPGCYALAEITTEPLETSE